MATAPTQVKRTVPPPPPTAKAPAPPVVEETPVMEEIEQTDMDKADASRITKEHVSYVLGNVKTKSYKEMAETLGISARDVNNILQNVKKSLRDSVIVAAKAAGEEAYGTRTLEERSTKSGKTFKAKVTLDFNNPLTEKAQRLETLIDEKFSRPEDARGGFGGGKKKGEGKMSNATSDDVAAILAELG